MASSLSSSLSSRLRRYVDPNAPKSSSRASQAAPASASTSSTSRPIFARAESGIAGPQYSHAGPSNATSLSQSGAPVPTLYEKSLPAGAGARASGVPVSAAGSEYDELQRALAASRQEENLARAMRESEQAEEEEALRRDKELTAERDAMEASRREVEEKALRDAEEEEQMVLRAIQESRAVQSQQQPGDRDSDDDEDVQRAMQISLQEDREDQIRQHEQFERIRQQASAATSPTSPPEASASARPVEAGLSVNDEAPPAYEPRRSLDQPSAANTDDKNLLFFPPLADHEMEEGSMRVFVPHMLFAARSRAARGESDEFLPMASRDVDLRALPRHGNQSSFSSKAPEPDLLSPAATSGPRKPRRPLPPLPPRPEEAEASSSSRPPLPKRPPPPTPVMSSGSYGFPRSDSPAPTISSVGGAPSHSGTFGQVQNLTPGTLQSGTSTANAVENAQTGNDEDPFDDSQASLHPQSLNSDSDDEDSEYYWHDRVEADQASGYKYAPEIMSATAEPQDWRSHEGPSSAHPTFSEIGSSEGDQTGTFVSAASQLESEHAPQQAALESAPVQRHDYTREVSDTTGLPRASSPSPAVAPTAEEEDSAGYLSWESTGSEAEDEPPLPDGESALDISSHVAFGFNPITSPNHELAWKGRMPDLILLSRHGDRRPGAVASIGMKEDYRTFAWEASTWRELLAYLMWHGNTLFQASASDEMPGAAQHMSIILEFVKSVNPPTAFVRLQVHLLGPAPTSTASNSQAPAPAPPSLVRNGNNQIEESSPSSASRGVALSRKPMSSRPNTASSDPAAAKGSSRHLVLAFPRPYQTLPCTLSTIASRLQSAQKTALARRHQLSRSRSASAARTTVQDAFLQDLLRGIEMCSDPAVPASVSGKPAQPGPAAEELDESRFERLKGRLRGQRQRLLKGTFRDLHKSTRSSRKSRWAKGSAARRGSADSGESHLESQPTDHDYHITPFRVDG